MPAPGMPAASAITVRHPEGTIRVSARTDVPLSELLLDLVELAGLPGRQDWVLGPLDGPHYAPDRTLAQLGVDDGAIAGPARAPRGWLGGRRVRPDAAPRRVADARPDGGGRRTSAE